MICLNYNVTTQGHLKSMEEMSVRTTKKIGPGLSCCKWILPGLMMRSLKESDKQLITKKFNR